MFTEGLDETALNWVREGADVQPTLYSSENISPNLASDPLIYNAASIGKAGNWGLPSTKLPPIHYRSGFLGPPLISSHLEGSVVLDVDDDESVGSAPEHGLYYSSGEDGDSVESDLQENPLLHHDYRGSAGHGVYMIGDHPKPSQETTYEYNCRYRYDRLQKSSPDPVSVLESRSGHGGAKRNVDPTQHGESLAASSEDIGSPEELPRENEENSTFYQEEKCAPPTTGFAEKRQEDKEEFHIPEPQPRSLSETGTPSAPPMFAPENEITEESALKTESKNSWRQSSRKSSPLHDIHTNQKHCSVPEPNDKCTGSACEEGEVQTSCRQTNSFLSPPTFYVSGHGAWQAFLAYEACIRLCLRAWATGCMEAPEFLNDECAVLRNAFGLQKVLLQPEEELLMNGPISSSMEETTAPRLKKTVEKIKVEVHRVKIKRVVPSKCNFPCAGPILEHFKSLRKHFSNMRSSLSAQWAAMKTVHVVSNAPRHSTYSQRGAAYMQAGAQYVRQLSGIIKTGVNTLCNSKPSETTQETFSCLLQLKSLIEEEASLMQPGSSVWMQPGSGDNHMFFPESQGDVLIVEVQDCKGNAYGRSWIKIASITDDPNDKIRWWPIYNEKHECVGKVQLSITNINTSGEMRSTKCGPVGETLAYDLVLEAAMRMQCFQSRNLRLHGPWKWLLAEFASYYGVSDSYTKLRYLSYIMDVATPTKDCFDLLYELLVPIIKARDENTLNRQEKRMLADSEDQLEHLLAMAFENYKSLEESSPSGLAEMFGPGTGIAAPALAPAVQVYTLLHDILSPDAQATLRNYIQMAARKRCKRHMAETDEFIMSNNDGFLMDSLTTSTAYLKMKALCMHIRDEVHTDIAIHNKHILPSCIDLPNITAGVYNVELCNRLRAFLVACPPSSPSTPVIELLIATADFQRDLASWNICPIKGGVDSKELFHLYIVLWIQDKRLYLLDFCKLEKVRLIETQTMTQHSTSPFVEEMYERIKDTLNEYEAIINRWPEYSIDLENAITTVERAVMRALEKQYTEVLTPLKDGIIPKKFGLQYMQKLARRNSVCLYSLPSHLGLFLNTIKRILDALHPKVEIQLRSWASCVLTPVAGDKKLVFGEQLNGITVMLRTKYKTFLQAIVERLADNTHVQRTTKLKRILQDTKEAGGENEIRERMQLLNSQLIETICQLHYIFDSRIFVAICRGFWDRMGQDVLYFLENRKENRSWYKGSCFALGILDDTFASQMQRLQGNALQEKDLDPPRSIMEARSMLCRETPHGADSSNYYYL